MNRGQESPSLLAWTKLADDPFWNVGVTRVIFFFLNSFRPSIFVTYSKPVSMSFFTIPLDLNVLNTKNS